VKLTGQPDQRRRRRPLYRCRHLRVLSPVRAAVFWFRRRLIAAARDAKYGTLVTATEAPILTTPIALLGGTFSALPTLLSFSFLPPFWVCASFGRPRLVPFVAFGPFCSC